MQTLPGPGHGDLTDPRRALPPLRHLLHRLGSTPRPLEQADTAVEANRFLGYVLGSDGPVDLDHHPLATWEITRPFTELAAWPFTGMISNELRETAPIRRRGRHMR